MTSKLYTLLCCATLALATTLPSTAQNSIGIEDMPYLGYEHIVATQTNPAVDVGIGGGDAQTWDFTSLQASAYDTVRFVDPAATPAGGSFPTANMARSGSLPSLLGVGLGDLIPLPLDLFPGTAYYTKNADGKVYNNGVFTNINIPGLIDLGEQSLAADPADLFLAPMEFGQWLTNEGEYSLVYELQNDTLPIPIPITLRLRLNKTVTADGYGTLLLPDDQYSVLRYSEDIVADIFVGVEVFGIPVQSFVDTTLNFNIVRFLSKGENYPVATVTISPSGTGEPTPLSIEYFDEPGPLGASFATTVSCLTATFDNNSSNAIAYNWDFGDGSTGSSQIAPSYQYTLPGTYTVSLTAFGVDGTAASVTQQVSVDYCIGLDNNATVQAGSMYPTATNGNLYISLPAASQQTATHRLQVFNVAGQLAYSSQWSGTSTTADLHSLAAGTYYCTISNEQGAVVATQSIVKQ